jgi:ketosteroid isomerase-like protein
MGARENKELVRKYLSHQMKFEIAEAFEYVAPDATWWMPGHLPFSGTYTREAILAVFTNARERFDGIPDMKIVSMTAEEDRVAVEIEGKGKMRTGLPYANTYHMLFRVRDGKIASCKNYQDIHHIWELMQADSLPQVKSEGR